MALPSTLSSSCYAADNMLSRGHFNQMVSRPLVKAEFDTPEDWIKRTRMGKQAMRGDLYCPEAISSRTFAGTLKPQPRTPANTLFKPTASLSRLTGVTGTGSMGSFLDAEAEPWQGATLFQKRHGTAFVPWDPKPASYGDGSRTGSRAGSRPSSTSSRAVGGRHMERHRMALPSLLTDS
eukprot:TRINITY_DN5054_c0_g1_i3.p1 TRINITY_DN5054_c0_g1~~TRINITY_DN5054_c0_g1_i3.p1  ORF type:complete len:179 (-),score=14.33 TRINITY_DN5054_c0_g1_i3:90-626(-)